MPYTSQAPIPTSTGGVLAPSELARTTGGQGEQALGSAIMQLGQSMQQIRDARDAASATAEYNRMTNDYMESLRGKDPREFDFIGNFEKLTAAQNKILKGKSNAVQQELNNKFTVMNEVNRAKIQDTAIRTEIALAKQELPEIITNHVGNGQSELAIEHIERMNAAGMFSPPEKQHFEQVVRDTESEFEIWGSINQAVDNPTQANLSNARAVINEHAKDEQLRYQYLQRIRGGVGNKNRIEQMVHENAVNQQATELVDHVLVSGSAPQNMELFEEIEPLEQTLINRAATGSLDVSVDGGQTYNAMNSAMDYGQTFTEYELAEAFGESLSREQYMELKKKNAQNQKLSEPQKEELRYYGDFVNTRYNEMRSLFRENLQAEFMPLAMAALRRDRQRLDSTVRNSVLSGEDTVTVHQRIDQHFAASSSEYLSWWGQRRWSPGVGFQQEARDIEELESRQGVMVDLAKAAVQGDDAGMKKLKRLMDFWYNQ